MLIEEIVRQPVMEMTYRQKKAESIITGLEKPINEHLIKMLVVQATDETKSHWRRELVNWLEEIMEIRLKPDTRPGSEKFYFRILFDEPFGGVEVANVGARIRRIAREYTVRTEVTVDTVVDRLRDFHLAFARRCHQGGRDVDDLLDQLRG